MTELELFIHRINGIFVRMASKSNYLFQSDHKTIFRQELYKLCRQKDMEIASRNRYDSKIQRYFYGVYPQIKVDDTFNITSAKIQIIEGVNSKFSHSYLKRISSEFETMDFSKLRQKNLDNPAISDILSLHQIQNISFA